MDCWLWARLYLVTSWNASAMKSFHSSSSSLAISSPIHWSGSLLLSSVQMFLDGTGLLTGRLAGAHTDGIILITSLPPLPLRPLLGLAHSLAGCVLYGWSRGMPGT